MADASGIVAPVEAVRLPIAGQPAERCDARRNRRRILAAARAIVAEHGADGLSMNAVASTAGVGKGTIFRRFGDRVGLLHALLDDDTAALQEGFLSGPPPLGPGAAPDARLEAFVAAFVRFELGHLELLLASEQGHVVAAAPTSAFRLHIATLLGQLDPALDAPVLADMILHALSPRALWWLTHELDATPARVQRTAITLLHGVVADRRRG